MGNKALIVIDVQNDFCTGGALAVEHGDRVVPVINNFIERFENVVLTQDWHPSGHSSFASSHESKAPFDTVAMAYGMQTLWPDHCVQGSVGAQFHADLNVNAAQLIVRKGFRYGIDSYSAFFENDRETSTGLAGYLRERDIFDLTLVGLATDFCVGFSAIDAVAEGFEVTVRLDACRGIDLDGSVEAMLDKLRSAGVNLT